MVRGPEAWTCAAFHPRGIFKQQAQSSQNSWCSFHINQCIENQLHHIRMLLFVCFCRLVGANIIFICVKICLAGRMATCLLLWNLKCICFLEKLPDAASLRLSVGWILASVKNERKRRERREKRERERTTSGPPIFPKFMWAGWCCPSNLTSLHRGDFSSTATPHNKTWFFSWAKYQLERNNLDNLGLLNDR